VRVWVFTGGNDEDEYIIGATGYTGAELLRLLLNHPQVEVTALTSQKYAGVPIDQVFPSLQPSPIEM
jgi:N-acetyl-gamma-glutamylphosphate reductase